MQPSRDSEDLQLCTCGHQCQYHRLLQECGYTHCTCLWYRRETKHLLMAEYSGSDPT